MYSCYRIERRRHKRVIISLSLVCKVLEPQKVINFLGNDEFESEAVDFSEGGLSLLSNNHLPIGTKIKIRVILFESDPVGAARFYEPLVITSLVCSSIMWKGYYYRIGLCYLDVNDSERKVIADLVQSHLRKSKVLADC